MMAMVHDVELGMTSFGSLQSEIEKKMSGGQPLAAGVSDPLMVPRVLVTCRSQQLEVEGDENENVPLYYYITDNIKIQFGREEFCLVTGLRFGVENLADYNDGELPIPFRRRVFPSSLDGEHITGNMVFRIIEDELFDRLHDDDAVSLCCLGILQLVLLGVEGKRRIPDWMLRLANDRGNMPAARLTPDETEARSD
ncbi:hypothetical protein Tco_1263609 [Tanacetum coccineum]